MRKYITFAILIIALFGCAEESEDKDKFLNDKIMELIGADENSEVQIVYMDKDLIDEQIETLNKACFDSIESKAYYKVRKRNLLENTSDIYYIDPETNTVTCKLRALLKPADEEELEIIEDEEPPADEQDEDDPAEEEDSGGDSEQEEELHPDDMTIDISKAGKLLVEYLEIEDERLSSKETNTFDIIETGDEVRADLSIYPRMDFDGLKARLVLMDDSGEEFDEAIISYISFDVNDTNEKRAYLEIPEGEGEEFDIKLQVYDEEDMILEKKYRIEVEVIEDDVEIDDFYSDPEDTIDEGRLLTTTVELENNGNDDAEDLNLTVEIRELDVFDEVIIEEIEEDGRETYELVFRIPPGTDEDRYRVDIILYNENGVELDRDDFRIDVEES